MCQRRRLLSLLLFGRARLRPHRSSRHLRAWLSADSRSFAIWGDVAAEEDTSGRNYRALVRYGETRKTLLTRLWAKARSGWGETLPDPRVVVQRARASQKRRSHAGLPPCLPP